MAHLSKAQELVLFNSAHQIESDNKKEINILLLGETGVGKSTFINSFVNYLYYDTLEEALADEVLSLIPSAFTVTDENYEEKEVFLGDDQNEAKDVGHSCTQRCKCYVFPFRDEEYIIRLIDTPGVGDTRGVDHDKLNFENILSFIGQYNELHCICILLKPNNSKINVTFEFCIKQLLCHLQKSASQNIVFLFTNARSTFYRPGDTVKPLRKILQDIHMSPPYVEIAFKRETVYCFDNEAFRFLVALKNGIRFAEDEVENFSKSWDTSAKECLRLIEYIIGSEQKPGLNPHRVQDTISVNEARRQIVNLSQPLADIIQNIEDNVKVMKRQKDEISANASNIAELRKQLFIPYLDLEITEIPYPKTVCSSHKCSRTYNVLGLTKREFSQVCHRHCMLSGSVTKDTIGDPGLMRCAAMDGYGKCIECPDRCGYQIHLHVYYETKVIEKRKEDDSVKGLINDKETAKALAENKIKTIEYYVSKNATEVMIITKTTAKFAHFLKNNAIAPYNDSFKNYLEHLIENEKSISKNGGNNSETVKGLEDMLKAYKKEKEILDKAMADNKMDSFVTAEEVFTLIEKLYNLPINGDKIRETQEKQQRARKSENFSTYNEIYFKPKKYSRFESAISHGLKYFGIQ